MRHRFPARAARGGAGELEYFLSSNHWLDASGGPVERVYPSLVAAVRGRLGSARQTDAHPEPGAAPITPAGPSIP